MTSRRIDFRQVDSPCNVPVGQENTLQYIVNDYMIVQSFTHAYMYIASTNVKHTGMFNCHAHKHQVSHVR